MRVSSLSSVFVHVLLLYVTVRVADWAQRPVFTWHLGPCHPAHPSGPPIQPTHPGSRPAVGQAAQDPALPVAYLRDGQPVAPTYPERVHVELVRYRPVKYYELS